jgi:hypothetical protein
VLWVVVLGGAGRSAKNPCVWRTPPPPNFERYILAWEWSRNLVRYPSVICDKNPLKSDQFPESPSDSSFSRLHRRLDT